MSEHESHGMEQEPQLSQAEFEELQGKVGGLSNEQKEELIAQLHGPDTGPDHWTNPASH